MAFSFRTYCIANICGLSKFQELFQPNPTVKVLNVLSKGAETTMFAACSEGDITR